MTGTKQLLILVFLSLISFCQLQEATQKSWYWTSLLSDKSHDTS